MKVKVGISNRHIHITEEDYKIIYGKDNLNIRNYLSQPNNFASEETVTIKTDKSQIERVRILGPFRKYTQVEISKTDAIKLGINPPIRTSGDLENSSEVTIIGPAGSIKKQCCIIPNRHIHITEEDYKKYKFDKTCSVKIDSIKPTILENVYFKIGENSVMELHLDTDDGNATLLQQKDEVEIIK